MKRIPRRDGVVGTAASIGPSSTGIRFRHNLPYLMKARDILTAVDRGIYEASPLVFDVCTLAVNRASDLSFRQSRVIVAVWLELAEAGKLHGIRTSASRHSGVGQL